MLMIIWGHGSFNDMFVLTVPVLEKILRAMIVYASLMIGLRLAGKRELAQLNPFDLIVLLTLSNTVQNAIIGDDNTVTGGILGAATLLGMNYLLVRLTYRSRYLQRLIGGQPDVLVHDGRLRHEHLRREMITVEELTAAAHRQGIDSLEDVQKCILEPAGTLTFIQRKPTTDDQRHRQLLDRLDQVTAELAAIKTSRHAS